MIAINAKVENTFTMRRSKAYAMYGEPAKAGDTGTVVSIHDLRDVIIVVIDTAHGKRHTHIQNLIELPD